MVASANLVGMSHHHSSIHQFNSQLYTLAAHDMARDPAALLQSLEIVYSGHIHPVALSNISFLAPTIFVRFLSPLSRPHSIFLLNNYFPVIFLIPFSA